MYQSCIGFDLKLGLIFCTYLPSTLIYDNETQLLSYLLAQMTSYKKIDIMFKVQKRSMLSSYYS